MIHCKYSKVTQVKSSEKKEGKKEKEVGERNVIIFPRGG